MELALTRALDPADPAYGFLRSDAQLAVAFIGVTADCSVAPAHVGIFDPDGDRRFWSDPTQPTPGVCWNAGVRCSGTAPEFSTCAPESWDMSGEPGASAGNAVLLPVERTVALLDALVQTGSTAGVVVTARGGVPVGYDTGGVVVRYSTSCTPDTTTADGICPGCMSEHGAGTPPVRVAAVAQAFAPEGEPGVASICSDEPAGLWVPLASRLEGQIRPACVTACVADTDPATAVLDPRCEVVELVHGEEPTPVPRCDTQIVDGEAVYTAPTDTSSATPS
ncbi:hypothetical protein [Nannocystis pusilla]|uniref:hypothetical protein n=1 Tax=Nannocystis pusilla TaxID=889268 RepID=UPI003B77EFCF